MPVGFARPSKYTRTMKNEEEFPLALSALHNFTNRARIIVSPPLPSSVLQNTVPAATVFHAGSDFDISIRSSEYDACGARLVARYPTKATATRGPHETRNRKSEGLNPGEFV